MRAYFVARFKNSSPVTSITTRFSTHKGTKINNVVDSKQLNVMVQLYYEFHLVVLLSAAGPPKRVKSHAYINCCGSLRIGVRLG